jgi:hypothetical protein
VLFAVPHRRAAGVRGTNGVTIVVKSRQNKSPFAYALGDWFDLYLSVNQQSFAQRP